MNPDAGITFAQFIGANGPSFGGSKSIKLDFYSYGPTTGQTDTLYSKIFTGLSNTDSLKFDWAHAQYSQDNDRLIVKLSQDGGRTFPYTLFDKSGSALATAPATTNAFVPTAGQWKTFSYGLDMLIPVELTSFTLQLSAIVLNLIGQLQPRLTTLVLKFKEKRETNF